MVNSKSFALESISATYTDSESEDGVSDQEYSAKSIESASSLNNDSGNGNKNASLLAAKETVNGQILGSSDMDTNQQFPEHQVHLSDEEADSYGVIIPPEPPGECPSDLIEKMKDYHEKVARGLDMNEIIQKNKNFRNPSMYEKFIEHCDINEYGTNFSPDKFNPFKWGKDSFYDELAKEQYIEMEKLEKAQIVSGTAKRPFSTVFTSTEDDAKWDQTSSNPAAATVLSGVAKPMVITQSALNTLRASVTATKITTSTYGSF